MAEGVVSAVVGLDVVVVEAVPAVVVVGLVGKVRGFSGVGML